MFLDYRSVKHETLVICVSGFLFRKFYPQTSAFYRRNRVPNLFTRFMRYVGDETIKE